MRVFLAYLSVVLLWSTTPLAIKWSGEGPGFLFGATARMSVGLVCVLALALLTRQPLPWRGKAWPSYLAVSLHLYCGMLAVYWAAGFVPSGWVAVIFGLTPMLNAPMAALWLGERSLGPGKLLSYLLGLAGLAIMHDTALKEGDTAAVYGIAGVLVSSFLQAASAVWLKRLNAGLPALTLLSGGLSLSVPAYLATWAIFDGAWPENLPLASAASILYLGAVATTVGFSLYFFLLKRLSSMQVALVTLLTPVMALLLGNAANGEPLTPRLLVGAGLILLAVLFHEFRFSRNAVKASSSPPVEEKPARGSGFSGRNR